MATDRNTDKTNIGLTGGGGQLIAVRVVDVILDATHPNFERFGGWDGLGTIFWSKPDDLAISSNPQNDTLVNDKQNARPLFQNQKFYPLKNEYVLIFTAISKDVLKPSISPDGKAGANWYLPNMNIWNHPHHNALPQFQLSNDPEDTSPKKFKETEAGVVLREFADDGKDVNSVNLGGYFLEREITKPLMPYEGDYILEGRFGNSIRFGSTTPYFEKENIEGKQIQKNLNNAWSVNSLDRYSEHTQMTGKIGDPVLIIRNEQAPPRTEFDDPSKQDSKGWIPTIEDINRDGSTIMMTSNQAVNIVVAGAKDKNPHNQEEVDNKSFADPDEKKLTFKDAANAALEDVWETGEAIVNEFIEFVEDPLEYVAPTQPTITSTESIAYDDGDNDFSFADEMIASGQAENADIEKYIVDFENTDISGTEMSISEREEWSAAVAATVGETPTDDDDYGTKEDYTTVEMDVPGYSVHTVPVLDTSGKMNKWFEEWKNGEVDYPCLIKNKYGSRGVDNLMAPLNVRAMINRLKQTNVNASNLPRIKNLVLHITATSHQIQHKLARFFLYQRDGGWTRSGYNLSVSGDGLVNYNVDLNEYTHANGAGGNALSKRTIGGSLVTNTNSINMSWIGNDDSDLADPSITSGKTKGPNITKEQAYAYEQLVRYFVKAFPDIKIYGHNMISIGKSGTGKSCPTWDPVEWLKAIGLENYAIQKHLDEYTTDEKKKMNGYKSKYGEMNNFAKMHGDTYRRTAQYVAALTGNKKRTDLL